jgi:acetyl-CoA C-acetyltransferase
MTKHVFGLYGTAPPPAGPVVPPDGTGVQARLEAVPQVAIAQPYAGLGTVASYTVAHGRDGAPDWGLVLADVAPGVRAYGRVEDPGLLAAMEAEEWVGRAVTLREAPAGVNLVTA